MYLIPNYPEIVKYGGMKMPKTQAMYLVPKELLGKLTLKSSGI